MSKKMDKIVIVAVVTVGVAAAGLFALERVIVAKLDSKIAQVATPENIEQINGFMNELKEYVSDEQINATLNNLMAEADEVSQTAETEETGDIGDETDEMQMPKTESVKTEPVKTEPVADKKTSSQTEQKKQPTSIGDIPVSDKVRGMELASKLNMQYLMNASQGGLTPEAKRQIKEHVYERLTQAEIQECIAYYNKYSYLLTK